MQKTVFPTWPHYAEDEIAATVRVLESGRVNYWNGDENKKFEREFSAFHGAEYGVAVANGTVALDLALHALNIGSGDEVVVTPRTFLASVSCIVNAGARPVFADVNRNSQNITAESISEVVSSRTRAIIAVHLSGWPCEMNNLLAFAKEHSLFVIEDCAQAHGAVYKGHRVGGIGHLGTFSFCTDKIMSTGGEGGMVLTNDHSLWSRMWSYKDHGKSWDAVYNRDHPPGFRWVHDSFGTNWRLTEMQAAIGRIQLRKLPEWIAQRQANARVLIEGLSSLPGLRTPVPSEDIEHAYYKFYTFIRPERLREGWSRESVITELQGRGIPCQQGICPEVYLERAFEGSGLRPDVRLPVAHELGETSIMIPVHPTLSEAEMEIVVNEFVDVMNKATKANEL